jgi:N-acetyl-anhydromuramyl-L-alanine amidase AmpD
MLASKILFLFIHCSATRPSMNWDISDVRRSHLQRGFFDVGYHYVIKRDGEVQKGRPDDQPGAHVSGYNGKSLGICMIGGVTEKDVNKVENNFTPAQFKSLHTLVSDLHAKYPQAKILGHGEVAKKACPSFDVQQWLKDNPL